MHPINKLDIYFTYRVGQKKYECLNCWGGKTSNDAKTSLLVFSDIQLKF